MLFILASLGVYESQYVDGDGSWYSRESMDLYQYVAYILTYVVSFPIGTFLALFDASFLGEKWWIVGMPNFVLYFFVAKLLTKSPSPR